MKFGGLARSLLIGLVVMAAAYQTPARAEGSSALEACMRLTERLLSIEAGSCSDAELKLSGGHSVAGEPLLYREYAATSRRILPRRVLLIGGTHGDELSSTAVVFDWMAKLSADNSQPFNWLVIPCLNPDGYLAKPAKRMNARGVDLNRNLPTPDWETKAALYWEKRTKRDPRRYPGPVAASEPETTWLLEQIKAFKPDAIISIHAPYGLLDFDGPRTPPNRLGFLNHKELGTYPGSLGSYAGEYLKVPILTIELPNAFDVPTPVQSRKLWSDLLTWLERNVPKGDAPQFQRLTDIPKPIEGGPDAPGKALGDEDPSRGPESPSAKQTNPEPTEAEGTRFNRAIEPGDDALAPTPDAVSDTGGSSEQELAP